jgi:hypothetical protein
VRFAFEADTGDDPPASPEALDLRWVPLAEVSRLAPERSLLRMVGKTPALPPAGPH